MHWAAVIAISPGEILEDLLEEVAFASIFKDKERTHQHGTKTEDRNKRKTK